MASPFFLFVVIVVCVCLCNCISEIMNGGSSQVVSSTQFAPHIAVSCVCWSDEGADFASHLVAPLGSWNDYLNYQGYGFAFPLVVRVCGVCAHFGSTWGGYRHEGGTVKARNTRFGLRVFPHQWTCQAPSRFNSTTKVLLSYPAGGAQAGNRRQVLIGEAACPGPGPLILSVNVSSLEAGWPDVADLAWDVALIQEARVSPDSLVLGDIRRAHCQIFLSAPDTDGSSLLAVIVRSGSISPLDITSHPRAMSVVWYYGGCYPCRLYNLYGAADGTELTALATSTLVRNLLIDAEASGRVPSLIAGDFNLEFPQLHCIGNLVASGWKDIGSEPTCAVASTTVPRRIDMLLANDAFHALVTG